MFRNLGNASGQTCKEVRCLNLLWTCGNKSLHSVSHISQDLFYINVEGRRIEKEVTIHTSEGTGGIYAMFCRWDLQRLREEQQLQRLRARQEKQIISINQLKREDTPSILPNLEVRPVSRAQC